LAIATRKDARYRSVIFDFDEALLVRGPAWRYTVEEAVASVTGRRVDAGPLAEEYRRRAWRHALDILVREPLAAEECDELCQEIFIRGAMKKLLVHDGMGMALDAMRAGRVEVGAVTREAHAVAVKQVHSTGMDRLVAVLAATPEGERWDPAERVAQCLRFLGHRPEEAVFLGVDDYDLRAAERLGLAAYEAGWAAPERTGFPALGSPLELQRLVFPERP
jgi:phosphoglycolate phosphatase-like HAD superfamily hydrolase